CAVPGAPDGRNRDVRPGALSGDPGGTTRPPHLDVLERPGPRADRVGAVVGRRAARESTATRDPRRAGAQRSPPVGFGGAPPSLPAAAQRRADGAASTPRPVGRDGR